MSNTESATSLEIDSILNQASDDAGGLTDFGQLPFKGPLAKVLASLEEEARLNEIGRYIARDRMVMHSRNRLLYKADRERHPEISEEKIVKPVFIIGLPRTGTTILHDILGQDPNSRVPMTWECMFPSPPPQRETFISDPRIAQCQATFPDVDQMIPAFKTMHPMGAELSQECVTLMGETMITPLFHNQFRVPSYQDWVDHQADFADVYAFHHQQLQHFQWQCPSDRWMLKTGAHMWGLEHLIEQYPDARIVFTHRDPVKSMTSYASLTALVRSMGSDDVDREEIAADWTHRLHHVLNHAMDVRETQISSEAKIYEMYFSDFIDDQFSEIEKIYESLEIEMNGSAADAMRKFIADNPKGKHGEHSYQAADFGINPTDVRELFSRYIERFNLAPE